MKCPLCDIKMLYDRRKGIEISKCPDCQGVWIDDLEFERFLYRQREETAERKEYRRFDARQKKALMRDYLDTF